MRHTHLAVFLIGSIGLVSHTAAQQAEFDIEDTLVVGATEIDYGLNLVMTAVSPTRVGVEAALDFSDLQTRLPGLLSEEPILDSCGSRTDLSEFVVEAQGEIVSLSGKLDTQFFECTKTRENVFARGEPTDRWIFGFSASATARFSDKCVTYELVDAVVQPLEQLRDIEGFVEDVEALRVILLEVAGRFLSQRPFCPAFPEEFEPLDPVYESGGPREIGDGGLGAYLKGSIDTSTATIIGILHVLQEEGVVPGPP